MAAKTSSIDLSGVHNLILPGEGCRCVQRFPVAAEDRIPTSDYISLRRYPTLLHLTNQKGEIKRYSEHESTPIPQQAKSKGR